MQIKYTSLNRACEIIASEMDNGTVVIFDTLGNELVRCKFSSKAFRDATDGECVSNDIRAGVVARNGQCSSFVCLGQTGDEVCSGTAGVSGDMKFPTDRFFAGMVITVNRFSFSMKGGV